MFRKVKLSAITLFVLCFVMNSNGLAQNSNQLGLAVLDLAAEYGIDEAMSGPVTQRLRQEIQNSGVFNVIDRYEMSDKLAAVGIDPKSCNTPEKVAEAGRAVGVERVLVGSFTKIGAMISVSVKVINSLNGKVLDTKTVDCSCPIEEVITTTLPQIAAHISGKPVSTPLKATVAPKTQQPVQTSTITSTPATTTPQQQSQSTRKSNKGEFLTNTEHFGVQIGIDRSNLAVNSGAENFKPITGLALGFALEFNAQNTFSIRPEIWVHLRGSKIDTGDEDSDFRITYYSIPILAKFNFNKSGNTFPSLYIGPEFSAVQLMKTGDFSSSDEDDREALKKLFSWTDFGITLGGTLHVNNLYFDIRYYEGIKDILKKVDEDDLGGFTQDEDAYRKNQTFTFTVGYHFL